MTGQYGAARTRPGAFWTKPDRTGKAGSRGALRLGNDAGDTAVLAGRVGLVDHRSACCKGRKMLLDLIPLAKALASLERALQRSREAPGDDVVRDGVIQRFGYRAPCNTLSG